MNLWPVIERELRASARRPGLFWLRLGLAGGLAGLLVGQLHAGAYYSDFLDGRRLEFYHRVVLVGLWLLIPPLAADCLSRERREGTISLLMLTPLRPVEVAFGKVLGELLRGATALLAALPVLALPWLWTEATPLEIAFMFLLDASVLVLALAAGVLASACCTKQAFAIPLALSLAGLFLSAFPFVLCLLMRNQVFLLAGRSRWVSMQWLGISPDLMLGAEDLWRKLFQLGWQPRLDRVAVCSAAEMLVLSLMVGWYVARLAGWMVWRRRDASEPPRGVWALSRWGRAYRSRRQTRTPAGRRLLERNPAVWLQWRSPLSRSVRGSLLGLYALTLAAILAIRDTEAASRWMVVMTLPLLLGVAFSAVSSFVQEREQGAFELLFTTPLQAPALIIGRLRALWVLFLPTVLLWCAGWLLSQGFWPALAHGEPFTERLHGPARALAVCLPICVFVAFMELPAIGLGAALRCRTLAGALTATIILGIALPAAPLVCLADWPNLAPPIIGPFREVTRAVRAVELSLVLEAVVGFVMLALGRRTLARRDMPDMKVPVDRDLKPAELPTE